MRMPQTNRMPSAERAPRAARSLGALLVAGLVLALAAPALAGSVYRWETPEGGMAFTDDPERIPASQRDGAERVEMESLAGYGRFTPKREEAAAGYEARLSQRIERLRALNADASREPEARAAAAAGTRDTVLEMGRGMKVRVPRSEGDASSEPLVVEKVRVREPGGSATKTNTVVRRGDEVFVVVSPVGDVDSRPGSVPSEATLFGDESGTDE